MKLTMTKHKKYLIVGSLVLATATPSFAIFGVGDIVFDPTSYASLVSQATTALNQLKTIQSNVEHFSVKQQWQTALTKLENMNVASMFGETAGTYLDYAPNNLVSRNAWVDRAVGIDASVPIAVCGVYIRVADARKQNVDPQIILPNLSTKKGERQQWTGG